MSTKQALLSLSIVLFMFSIGSSMLALKELGNALGGVAIILVVLAIAWRPE